MASLTGLSVLDCTADFVGPQFSNNPSYPGPCKTFECNFRAKFLELQCGDSLGLAPDVMLTAEVLAEQSYIQMSEAGKFK